MIDSRYFVAAARRADNEAWPAGPKVAFTGEPGCNDHHPIWDRLDKVLARQPDTVLRHGRSPKGAERIAASLGRQPQGPADRLANEWIRRAEADRSSESPG